MNSSFTFLAPNHVSQAPKVSLKLRYMGIRWSLASAENLIDIIIKGKEEIVVNMLDRPYSCIQGRKQGAIEKMTHMRCLRMENVEFRCYFLVRKQDMKAGLARMRAENDVYRGISEEPRGSQKHPCTRQRRPRRVSINLR